MKKLPNKFQVPLVMSIMVPTMLLGMPAIVVYRNATADSVLFDEWIATVSQTLPLALLLFFSVGSLARLVVTKFLVEPKEH
ncbi:MULTISPECIES: hypothetical protein [unclassified Neptuniibacter]|jgi:hypothetical protein|uniref:hypothetical protein n=1 Tax=unclassified Neptuniibacter TaxID=2630693 RepID=UPI0026E32270|nr:MULTISPECIES: hypothetical protein [unclassified Neptuniibacter]MDO6514413.1 hypothetical protein [Neptuniibacter sp. 2_MG-2023]MDO6594436.1 hypothetical protein [Neptuniibacter sp. 1_MG-2023]